MPRADRAHRWRWAAAAALAAAACLIGTGHPHAQAGWQTGTVETTPAHPDQPASPPPTPPAKVRKAAPRSAAPKPETPPAPPPLRTTASAPLSPPIATAATVAGDDLKTAFTLHLDRPVAAAAYAVADPYRVIVDLPDVLFRLPLGAGSEPAGLIKAFRYGMFQAGRSRIVIDVAGPVMVDRLRFEPGSAGEPTVAFDMVRIDRAEFDAIAAAEARRQQTEPAAAPRDQPTAALAETHHSGRPVVVVDPGHGGLDPGTTSGPEVNEKTVVLQVARQLEAVLAATHRYDVRLTRRDDVFIPLDQRVRIARDLNADLFISLHADAIAEREYVGSVRGATVYTLSDKASDEAARRAAEKENASDILAGIDAGHSGERDQVRDILFDLMRRETSEFSADFRGLLIDRLRGRIALSRDPQRSAAFIVLRQAETPSVLIELGYLSNPEDRARMTSADWQRQAALTIASAIDAYFSRHPKTAAR